MMLSRCETRPPPVRCQDPPMRQTWGLAAADHAMNRGSADLRPLHGSAIYQRAVQAPLRDHTTELAPGADSHLTPATSPDEPNEHRCLLLPRRPTIRQTRRAETQEAAVASCVLKIGQLNVRSLTAHLDQVNLLLLRERLDVLCLSETWLTETVDTSTLLFPGYTICRRDRSVKKTGGGVAILYRSSLKAEQLRVPSGSSTLEALWLQIASRSSIVAGMVYRPPSGPTAPAIDCLHQQLTHVLSLDRPIYLLGDVNFDVLHPAKQGVSSYLQHLSDLSLRQPITEPTRPGPAESLIDHLITNRPDLKPIL